MASVLAARSHLTPYEVHLATALDPALIRVPDPVRPRILQLAKAYGYVAQAGRRAAVTDRPAWARRAAGRLDSFARLLRNREYIADLAAYIRRHEIRLVHLNNGFENLEAHLAATLTRRPVLIHAHGGSGTLRLTRMLARRIPQSIAISEPAARGLCQVGVPPERVTVIHNPLTVDPTPLDPDARDRTRRAHGLPTGGTVIGIVGRIVAWKGQLEFLRAAALVLRDAPDAVAVIIGDVTDANDAYGVQVRQAAANLGIADRVRFTGFVPDPREVYALVDVLVHCSINPEPFGLVLTEAMALGIPVLAADRGGPLEIITDGVDGYLRDPTNPDAVAERVVALVRDRELRERIGRAGRESALRRFDPDAYAARVASVYDRVLRRNASMP